MEIKREGLEKKFYDMCLECVQAQEYKLYDLEYIKGQKLLRLYIMDPKTGSAVLDDCIKVDRSLTPYFEENTWIPEDVVLEVSSPGVYKKLRCYEHFNNCLNERIKVKFRGEIEGVESKVLKKISSANSVCGDLKSLEKNDESFFLNIEVRHKKESYQLKIDSKNIVKAQCEPEF